MAECGIRVAGFASFHDHNEEERLPQVLARLSEGEELALVSDAGTPLLSDPGYRLVRACREAGIAVSPVPGPSAPVAALSASGLPPLPFVFLGFPPRKASAREAFFRPYACLGVTLIFFERKDRLASTLKSAFSVLGEREACIARELTKTYEEFISFSLSGHAGVSADLLGEITVIIGPAGTAPEKTAREDVTALLQREIDAGSKPREAAKNVQELAPGWSAKELYALLGDLRRA